MMEDMNSWSLVWWNEVQSMPEELLGHFVSILRKWSGHPFQFSWNFTQIVITPYDEHLQNLNEICQKMAWL